MRVLLSDVGLDLSFCIAGLKIGFEGSSTLILVDTEGSSPMYTQLSVNCIHSRSLRCA